jgi:hypothetical protein
MNDYIDEDIESKRRFVQNIPYFVDIVDDILILKIVLNMKFKKYMEN